MKKLDERNKELAKILFSLKQSIDSEKLLGLNADNINTIGIGKRFFVHIQMVLLESCVINICKIFEPEKDYQLNSIPAILNFIKSNDVQPKYYEYVNEFIEKYENNSEKDNYIETLEVICKNFYSKHKICFSQYDYVRNKVIAHAEYQAKRNSLPSHAVMKELLLFGSDFYYMISRAFLDVGPHLIHNDRQAFSSLCNIFEKLGYKNIKINFDK